MKNALTLVLLIFCLNGFSQSAESFYKKAYQQLTDGVNATEVLLTLQSCIEADRRYGDAYILRAFILYKLEDYKAAITDYNTLLIINPEHEEALKKRAFTRLQLDDFEGAITDHTLRIKNNPENSVAYFDRAYVHGLTGKNELAIEDYNKAIELDEGHIAAYKNRGIARINQFLLENDQREPNIEEAQLSCEDFIKARKLGDASVSPFLHKYCILKE